MKQLQQQPSAKQINALLSLYKVYASSFVACGLPPQSNSFHAMNGEHFPSVLPLPLFSQQQTVRTQRLAWASGIVGRELTSFTKLRSDEAALLIDTLKRALGQKVIPPSRRRPDRDQAHAYGTAGRRTNESKEIRLVDNDTLGLLDNLTAQLGWTPERLTAFLNSRVSPVRSGAIRTLDEANRVIWALKNMIRKKEENSFYRRKES